MNAESLIEILNKERAYHSSHPHDVFVKFVYSLATSLAAVVASIYFSNGRHTYASESSHIYIVLPFFGLGLILVMYGLAEHNSIHFQQREKVEQAIQQVFKEYEHFNYDLFWKNHATHSLKGFGNKTFKKQTSLITLEPDTRGFWEYHDRKIELGIILVFFAYGVLIYEAYS